jgi:hypothetical protein
MALPFYFQTQMLEEQKKGIPFDKLQKVKEKFA